MHQEYFMINDGVYSEYKAVTGNILVVLWQSSLSYVDNYV
jgi:hypothetical protein